MVPIAGHELDIRQSCRRQEKGWIEGRNLSDTWVLNILCLNMKYAGKQRLNDASRDFDCKKHQWFCCVWWLMHAYFFCTYAKRNCERKLSNNFGKNHSNLIMENPFLSMQTSAAFSINFCSRELNLLGSKSLFLTCFGRKWGKKSLYP